MDQPHIYDLSYALSSTRKRKKAAFVFSIETEAMPELLSRVRRILDHSEKAVADYLRGEAASAFCNADDPLHKAGFGFGSCARVEEEDTTTHIRVELRGRDMLPHATLTMNVLFIALYSPLREGVKSNRLQLFDVLTTCDRGQLQGHGFMGHVSSTVCRALIERAKLWKGNVPPPEEVITSMKNAWIAAGGSPQFAQYCRGIITDDGRFLLGCSGNACDVAIYPDNVYDPSGAYGAGLSTHNLDTALQQVTLLAGLATLAQMVEKEEW